MKFTHTQVLFLACPALLIVSVGCGGHKSSKNNGTTTAPITSQNNGNDDHGDDAANATALGKPTTASLSSTGRIDSGATADVDWFSVDLTQGKRYEMRALGLANMDSVLRLVDSDATTQLDMNDDVAPGDPSSFIAFTPTKDGLYYLEVSDKNGATGGTYRLRVVERIGAGPGPGPGPGPQPSPSTSPTPNPSTSPTPNPTPNPNDDHGNDSVSSTATSSGTPTAGQIDYAADEDWFAVDLSGGVDYSFITMNLANGMDTILKLYEPNGTTLIAENDDVVQGDPTSRVDFTPPADATYFFAVLHNDSTVDVGNYDVNAVLTAILPPPPLPDDHGNDDASATVISMGSTTAGKIENAGDMDWFAIDLLAGTDYHFYTDNLANGMDTIIYLIDTDGITQLERNDDSRLSGLASSFLASRVPDDPASTFNPPVDGTYYVYVEHFRASADTGDYDMIAEIYTPRADDHGNDSLTATVVAMGATTSGQIENAGDEDWFAVDLRAGFGYEFKTSNMANRMDSVIELIDTDGLTSLDMNDDDNTATNYTLASRIPDDAAEAGFTPTASGTYYVIVRQLSSTRAQGDYDVTVEISILPPGPVLQAANLDDTDGSLHASAGDVVTLTFNEELQLSGSDLSVEVALPVAGDSFGTGATVAQVTTAQVAITLGQDPVLRLSGSFNDQRLTAGESSGLEVLSSSTIASVNTGVTAEAVTIDLSSGLTTGFQPAVSLNTARGGHTATLLNDGRVLAIGGLTDGPAFVTTSEILDAGAWTEVDDASLGGNPGGFMVAATGSAAFAVGRYDHTATKLASGEVLIAGGFGYERLDANGDPVFEELTSAFLFDPATNVFTPAASPLVTGRSGHQATLLPNGQVMISGGFSALINNGQGGTLQAAELYDPFHRVFSPISGSGLDMVLPREAATAHEVNGLVVVVGGHRWDATQFSGNVGLLLAQGSEIFDPTRGFTTNGALGTDRRWHAATKLSSGDLIVLGGDDGGQALNSVERYDAATGTFSPAGALNTPRLRLQAAPVGDDVLAVGGINVDWQAGTVTYVDTGELLNTRVGISETYQLGMPRNSHSVVQMPDGRVLVVGGFANGAGSISGIDGTALGECEVFVRP